MTEITTTEGTDATVTAIAETSARGIVRATWKQHGNPTSGFTFYGTAAKLPAETGVEVAKVVTDKQGITLKGANGRALKGGAFGSATKFWALVPEDAPRAETAPAEVDPAKAQADADRKAAAAARTAEREAAKAARQAERDAKAAAREAAKAALPTRASGSAKASVTLTPELLDWYRTYAKGAGMTTSAALSAALAGFATEQGFTVTAAEETPAAE
jgi:hypothetical protein